jgi:hypothetical protein
LRTFTSFVNSTNSHVAEGASGKVKVRKATTREYRQEASYCRGEGRFNYLLFHHRRQGFCSIAKMQAEQHVHRWLVNHWSPVDAVARLPNSHVSTVPSFWLAEEHFLLHSSR